MKIKNLVAAAYAPMNADCDLNTNIIKKYGQFLRNNKITGVFINGSTGDFASLTVSERKTITKTWSESKPEGLYLIDHVGHTSLKVSKELATYASDKVDAISAIAPFYFRLNTIEKLVAYCKEVAACAPNLPFYYYHLPVLSGADLNMKDFLEQAEKVIPNLAGIKFTNNNLIDYQHSKKVCNQKFNILFGYDELFINSLPLGATGWVGSTYNHMAPLYYKIKEYFENGQMKEACSLQTKAIRFVEILNSKGGFNGAGKGFMKILGLDLGPSRFPHITLSDADYVEIKKELDVLGIEQYYSF